MILLSKKSTIIIIAGILVIAFGISVVKFRFKSGSGAKGFLIAPENHNGKQFGAIENGKLVLSIKGKAGKLSTRVKFNQDNPDYLEACISVENKNLIPEGIVGYARIAGVFYNDSHEPIESNVLSNKVVVGDMWVMNYLECDSDGKKRAKCVVARYDGLGSMQIQMEKAFKIEILADSEYRMSIEFTGAELIFKCNEINPKPNEAEKIVYDIKGPVYLPSQKDLEVAVRVHCRNGENKIAYFSSKFDDVRIKKNGSILESFN